MKVDVTGADVVWRELDGEVVILNLATGTYFGLEGAGNDMWRLLVEHGSTERVVEILADRYDVDAARLAHDLDTLVHELASRQIATIAPQT